ncbi:MAG: DUF4416 family protein [Proteobacteria bacterium]|nr:DUF4416 family protein [Pseudomonadota bacterium]
MSIPTAPKPAKLVIGVYTKEKDLVKSLADIFSREYGDIDLVSQWIPFDFTTYYEHEMGSPLYRRVFSFKRLIEQEALSDIKVFTNSIEQTFMDNGKRQVNIDPGYMLYARFVLATGKDFSHRIYIGKGIYADLTLIFQKGSFKTLPWTYPDYADSAMQTFLYKVRDKYAFDLKMGRTDLAETKPRG